jgi:hypothetical protein
MGVSRGRLCRQLLSESALLAAIAASAALAVTYVIGGYGQQASVDLVRSKRSTRYRTSGAGLDPS